MKEQEYKLKDFARLTNLSRKALLVYERKGLLLPERVDQKTGYRYYSRKQLRRAALLAFLRNLDVPLAHMIPMLEGKVNLREYFADNNRRMELIKQQIKVNHALQTIQICESSERLLNEKVELVILPQTAMLSLEGKGELKDVSLFFSLLVRFMTQYALRISAAPFTYYFKDCTPGKLHFKVCYPIESYISVQHSDIRCEIFPSTRTAILRHFGDYSNLYLTYGSLIDGIKEQGWACTGEYIESYVIFGDRKYTDSSTFVTTVAGILE